MRLRSAGFGSSARRVSSRPFLDGEQFVALFGLANDLLLFQGRECRLDFGQERVSVYRGMQHGGQVVGRARGIGDRLHERDGLGHLVGHLVAGKPRRNVVHLAGHLGREQTAGVQKLVNQV